MLRLIFFVLLLYLAWKLIRPILGNPPQSGRQFPNQSNEAIDDVMVKDPQCGVYFPLREGYKARINNQDLYFCSEECKKAFIASKK